jgi:hypothetical protein
VPSAYARALDSGGRLFCVEHQQQINYGLNHYEMGLWGPATIRPLVSAANSLETANPPDPCLSRILLALGTTAESHKRDDLAADFFRRALKTAEALRPVDEAQPRNALVDLGLFYTRKRSGDGGSAAPWTRHLAIALDQRKRHSEANALSMKALAVLDSVPPGGMEDRTRGDVESWRLRTVLSNYADLLRRTGREAEAQALERRATAIKWSPSMVSTRFGLICPTSDRSAA